VLLVFLPGAVTPVSAQPLSLVNVPFISQSEALCGGAAAAMVLRYWGATGLTAESFAGLVDRSAAGIRTDALRADLVARGWNAVELSGTSALVSRELQNGRPVIALIEDRPGTYHYVVVVGWHVRGVILHDPARVPYRVMPVEEFHRRWQATDNWLLAVAPGSRPATAESPVPFDAETRPAPSTDEPLSCGELIAFGVAEAQSNRLDVAERSLTSALACAGPEALRELAGVRALQRRWPEVIELASTVLGESPQDQYAWQLLATARFVSGDSSGALVAWNRAGQPRLDLIQVDGLRVTSQRVAERLTSLHRGDLLTPDRLSRAARQLADWPALMSAGVVYVPRPGGLSDLRMGVDERRRVPQGRIALGVIGARALITRELRLPLGPLTTQGDRIEFGWRFWPERPRYSAGLMAPAPWGGLWGVQVSTDRQRVIAPVLPTFRRDSAELTLSAWQTGRVRWQAGAGLDRWVGLGRFPTVQGTLDLASHGNGIRLRARAQSWLGRDGFGALEVSLRGNRALGSGYVLEGRAVSSRVSIDAPYDIWPAGDAGLARSTLLRAHPLVTDGKFQTMRLGASVLTGSVELQRFWQWRGGQFGPATFADLGRTARRVDDSAVVDVDLGVGFRARLPGVPGVIRIDVASGLRDGRKALSFVYEP
jgi:predicted double-glycine peptidase